MRKLIQILSLLFILNSCVQLPNLIPNGSGEESDMVIYEYNNLLNNVVYDDVLVVDDLLSIDFTYYPSNMDCTGDYKMKILGGHILMGGVANLGLTVDRAFQNLDNVELLGGLTLGEWKYQATISHTSDWFSSCLTVYNMNVDENTVVGIRFKDNEGKF